MQVLQALEPIEAFKILVQDQYYRPIMVSIIRWRIWTRFRAICKSATWVKLRELSLSYKLNLTNKNLGLESVTFTGTGRNLWLWTEADLGQDPVKILQVTQTDVVFNISTPQTLNL
jgi:hypothetical protein